jgi:hypothetical protein
MSALRRFRASMSETSTEIVSVRTSYSPASSSASSRRRSSRRAASVTPWPRRARPRAISAPIPDEAPVTRQVEFGSGSGSAI